MEDSKDKQNEIYVHHFWNKKGVGHWDFLFRKESNSQIPSKH